MTREIRPTASILVRFTNGILLSCTIASGLSFSATRVDTKATDESIGKYEIVDLGDGFEPQAVNNKGQTIGVITSSSRAFIWSEGKVTYIPPLEGDTFCVPNRINDSGQVLCRSFKKGEAHHTLIWSGSKVTRIQPPSGFSALEASDIGPTGDVVGTVGQWDTKSFPGFYLMGPRSRAFLYRNGKLSLLQSQKEKGGSAANGINASGHIVGYDTTKDGRAEYAALWKGGSVNAVKSPKSVLASADHINGSGLIVGTTKLVGGSSLGDYASYVNSKGHFQIIAGPEHLDGSTVLSLNDRGQVLMRSRERPSELAGGREHSWIWQAGKVTLLDQVFAGHPDWQEFTAI